MLENPLEIAVAASSALVVYHHALYPKLAAWLGERADAPAPAPVQTGHPQVTVVMPAFNEARHIAAKISNLAGQDWPAHRLRVLIGCDGCTDNTAEIARDIARSYPSISVDVIEFKNNRGKVAVLNDLMRRARGEIIVVSDVSALLPVNAINRLAAYFADPTVGAVGAGYRPACDTTGGEKAYWDYQSRIKTGEARLGGLIGAHGACYAIRGGLYRPLDQNLINDDFVVPMRIALSGWRTHYDAEVRVRELEASPDAVDFKRRIRIGRGNAQQLAMLLPRLSFNRAGLALAFLSGKGLRVAMPFLMLFALLGSAIAAQSGSTSMTLLLGVQAPVYLLPVAATLVPALRRFSKVEALRYLVSGHVASAIGALQFITGAKRGAWRRAATA
jgi:cellulose synthase/poly-beta-1,6-N-acetylglucosamine synthase-like glycosyltransferase